MWYALKNNIKDHIVYEDFLFEETGNILLLKGDKRCLYRVDFGEFVLSIKMTMEFYSLNYDKYMSEQDVELSQNNTICYTDKSEYLDSFDRISAGIERVPLYHFHIACEDYIIEIITKCIPMIYTINIP